VICSEHLTVIRFLETPLGVLSRCSKYVSVGSQNCIIKNMKIKVVLVLLALAGSFYIGGKTFSTFVGSDKPSQSALESIRTCTSLNQKPFSYELIKSLNWLCYVRTGLNDGTDNYGVGVQTCLPQHFVGYGKLKKEDTIAGNATVLHTADDGSFTLAQNGLENTWTCRIKIVDNLILAIPSYISD
jgi:hypothetical protein